MKLASDHKLLHFTSKHDQAISDQSSSMISPAIKEPGE